MAFKIMLVSGLILLCTRQIGAYSLILFRSKIWIFFAFGIINMAVFGVSLVTWLWGLG